MRRGASMRSRPSSATAMPSAFVAALLLVCCACPVAFAQIPPPVAPDAATSSLAAAAAAEPAWAPTVDRDAGSMMGLMAANALPTSGTTDPAVLAAIPPFDPTAGLSVLTTSTFEDPAAMAAAAAAGLPTATALGLMPAAVNETSRVGRPRFTTAAKAQRDAAAREQALARAVAAGTVTPMAMAPIYKNILDKHNSYRARHQAGPLAWDDGVAAGAQAWANRCNFVHSMPQGVGQNLFATSSFDTASALNKAIDDWYNEVSKYNFNVPGFSLATGHFTQVVWRSTTKLGCAAVSCPRIFNGGIVTSGTIVVCNYSPAGNIGGQFPQNVLRAGSPPPPPPAPTPPPPAPVGPGNGFSIIETDRIPNAACLFVYSTSGCLRSPNRRFYLCAQTDSNIVLYDNRTPIWASNTSGRGGSARPLKLCMQGDANLVAYSASNAAFWSSNTYLKGRAPMTAVVQNDGNFVVYQGNGSPIWATNTVRR